MMNSEIWKSAILRNEQVKQSQAASQVDNSHLNSEIAPPVNREVLSAAVALEGFLNSEEGQIAQELLKTTGKEIELGTKHNWEDRDDWSYKTYLLVAEGIVRDLYYWNEERGETDPDPLRESILRLDEGLQEVVQVSFADRDINTNFKSAEEYMNWISIQLDRIAEEIL